MEVIDLTVDSPTKDGDEEARQRRTRRRERRAEGEGREEKEKEPRREDSRERRRESHRSERRGRDAEGGKRRHDSSRERDSDRKRRRKKDYEREDPVVPNEELFFIDDNPAPLPSEARYTTVSVGEEPAGLILPAHVSVFGETPADLPAAAALDSDEDDYIEYLDYDNRKDFVRYYEEEDKRHKIVCKKCGAEDEHTTPECRVLICLTCGARDEHPTRSCNIGKTCFSCGMKGHINSEWAKPGLVVAGVNDATPLPTRQVLDEFPCRASALLMQAVLQECPMLWRLYVYVEDAEQEQILQTRKAKKGLSLGDGGEGYIADDEWCYNCGGSGHWGDDCQEFYHPEPLVEPTAFSYHFLSKGPFTVLEASGSRLPREWEREIELPGGVGDVGRRAKKKEMEKLARRAQQQEDDDTGDWFQRNVKNRGAANIPTGPRKMIFGSSIKDSARPPHSVAASSSKVSLSDRIDPAPDRHRDTKSKSRRDRDRASDSTKHRGDRDRERDRDKDRHRRDERGPRYKGGYSR
ncbi:hypothetical protein C8R44DRAFT_872937 [Mycena epipterygia]|nr:hypothetical protein C8R44DRAFT_872937 [Mycena epipterygia]